MPETQRAHYGDQFGEEQQNVRRYNSPTSLYSSFDVGLVERC